MSALISTNHELVFTDRTDKKRSLKPRDGSNNVITLLLLDILAQEFRALKQTEHIGYTVAAADYAMDTFNSELDMIIMKCVESAARIIITQSPE